MKTTRMAWILVIPFLLAILAGCGQNKDMLSPGGAAYPSGRSITDMAGRKVIIPVQIHKVYAVSPMETTFLYTLDPDMLVGWSYFMAKGEMKFILPQYRNLPVLGAWTTFNNTASIEEIIKTKPDLIIMMKPITPAVGKLADEMQLLSKIPVVVIDGSMVNMEQEYLFAGKVLGCEARAAQLAAYCRETIGTIQKGKTLLAGRRPVSVYYAEGRGGLETEPAGSWHAEVIEFVGGRNVAGADIPSGGKLGRSPVSLEQVLLWNPDVILAGHFQDGESSSFPRIVGDKGWRDITAVRQHRVYEIPNYPFNWFDRPPSVNRIIGIRWVANLLYPDVYSFEFRAEVRRFYALFYHYQLSEHELDELSARTQR